MAKAKLSPLDDQLITVIGGDGLLGHYVVQALMTRGARLRVGCRHPERAFSLKPLGKVGQLQIVPCDVTKPETVRAAMAGVNGAINLAGAFGRQMHAVIAEGAGHIAQAASANGARALVQVSAIGADSDSPAAYGRAKAEGEHNALSHFPAATIIRPSIIAAPNGGFIPMLAKKIADFPIVPVFAPDRKLAPVYAEDCAQAIVNALAAPGEHGGKIYEIAGPEHISMMQLSRKMTAGQGRKRQFIALSDGMSSFISRIPFTPISHDQWLMLQQGNLPSADALSAADLGVKARPLSLFLERWMVAYRKNGRFTPYGPLPSRP